MSNPNIETETPGDADAIDEVVRRAFADEPGVEVMVRAIRASDRYRPELAFVAKLENHVVGFVMLSEVDLVGSDQRRRILSLTPLAVAPENQRQGVGKALVAHAIQAADRTGEPLVVLEGDPAYYGRLGFEFAGEYGIAIDLPEWAPAEAAQVYRLRQYAPTIRGHVDYPPAIAAVSGENAR